MTGFPFFFLWGFLATLASVQGPVEPDLLALQEQAMQAAVARVAPSVVQIETSGGADVIGAGPGGPQIRKGVGPTTGLVVAADGYIITSAFNFADKPAAVFVSVPGRKERFVARVVATDQTRFLTLLKIDAQGLPVPAAVPKREMRVGQWALAVGRTYGGVDHPPSVSVGIISALERIWGKAIQTDAKVSPVNYGGPLIDVRGDVLAVLIPASPDGQDETAGVEWYDSGIGFGIPLEDIQRVLPRLTKGQDLVRGFLGLRYKNADRYATPPEIGSVDPDSSAAKAGLRPGDILTEVNGVSVTRQAQVQHLFGPLYAGDTVSLKVRRDKEELFFPKLQLQAASTAFTHPFLGILPLRDDPEPGLEVRFVFPKSPAAEAGLKAGDRMQRLGLSEGRLQPFSGRDELTDLLNQIPPGTELKLQVQRKETGKIETVTLRLGVLSQAIPDRLPQPSSRKQALEPRKQVARGPLAPILKDAEQRQPLEKKKEPDPEKKRGVLPRVETGRLHRIDASGQRRYLLQVPKNYDPNVAHALVLWLHPADRGSDRELEGLAAAWEELCEDYHLLLVAPRAENETGWLASEADGVLQIVREVMDQYTIDPARVVTHGMGVGGQFAFYLGFTARNLVRGVATTGTVFTGQPKDNVATQRLAFFLVAGGQDPLAPAVAETKQKLAERKFPVIYREIPDMGPQYLDEETLAELVRWIDSLDRL